MTNHIEDVYFQTGVYLAVKVRRISLDEFRSAVAEILEEERNNRESVEDGWLIEKGRLCLGLACGIGAWVTFTDPAAIRFARKVDAENMLRGLRSLGKDDAFAECVIAGHSWIGKLADQRDTQRESGGSK